MKVRLWADTDASVRITSTFPALVSIWRPGSDQLAVTSTRCRS
jgi:hypothetical protein